MQRRMIRRTSLRAVTRAPLKSLLFGVLILALTAVLAVCATLLYSCDTLLSRRDQDYTTTALLQYETGGLADSEGRTRAWNELDFDALLQEPEVLSAQRTETLTLWPQGYQRVLKRLEINDSVLAVKVIEQSKKEARKWNATVTEVLYSGVAVWGQTMEINYNTLTDYIHCDALNYNDGGLTPETAKEKGYFCIEDVYLTYDSVNDEIVKVPVYWYIRGERPIDGHSYLIAVRGHKAFGDIGSGFPDLSLISGDCLGNGILDITDAGLDANDPAQKPFFDYAERYRREDNSVTAVVSSDPSYREEFTQGDYAIQEGGIYAPDATGCCLLPVGLAESLGVGVGDRVRFDVLSQDGTQLEYEITGLLSVTAEGGDAHEAWVYLSDAAGVATQSGNSDTAIGTLHLQNGTSLETLARLEEHLPTGVSMTVFDQGYESVSKALQTLRLGAIRLLGIAAMAGLALLILFAFLFIGRQAETLRTMSMLGTSSRLLRLYVCFGAGLLLAAASASACILSAALSGALNDYVGRLLSDPSRMYSNASLGIVKTPSAAVLCSPWVLALCALCVLAVGIALCLWFYHHALYPRQKKPARAGKDRRGRSAMIRGAGFKYVLLSVLRGGGRSLSVVLISLVLPMLLMGIGGGITRNQNALDTLTEETEIVGYVSDYSGKSRYGLHLQRNDLSALTYVEELTAISYAQADAAAIGAEDLPEEYPHTLVYTNDLRCWNEFADNEDFEIEWLAGCDAEFLLADRDLTSHKWAFMEMNSTRVYRYGDAENDPRTLWVIMPDTLMEANGYALGDSVRIDTKDVRPIMGDEGGKVDATDTYRIVGRLHGGNSSAAHATLYTNLENYCKFIVQTDTLPSGAPIEVGCLWVRDGMSACRFELKDTAQLQQSKDSMKRVGLSRIRGASRYRIFPVFDDKVYLEESEKLQNSITSHVWLLWIAGVLCAAAGMALGFLLISRRQTELAILRSLGMRAAGAATAFLIEQILLCGLGTLLSLGLWRLISSDGGYAWTAASFAGSYILGTAAGILGSLRKPLLSVLSEKE